MYSVESMDPIIILAQNEIENGQVLAAKCKLEQFLLDQNFSTSATDILDVGRSVERCIVVGCAFSKDALDVLGKAILLRLQRMPEICDLGNAEHYRILGAIAENVADHIKAEEFYKLSFSEAAQANAYSQACIAADALTLLYRRMGLLDRALEYSKDALGLRSKFCSRLEVAKSYHSLGNILRDKKEKEKSIASLKKALGIFSDQKSLMEKAQTLKDLGWAYFLFGDYQLAKHNAELSVEIAGQNGFSRIEAEGLHVIFEVVDREFGIAESESILDRAIVLAEQSSALFMLMDLLMHRCVHAVNKKDGAVLEQTLKSMQAWIDRGCRFYYFLGRAYNVSGDFLIDGADTCLAIERYHLGYKYLARGGESGSFLSSFKVSVQKHLPLVARRFQKVTPEEFVQIQSWHRSWIADGLDTSHAEVHYVLVQLLQQNRQALW